MKKNHSSKNIHVYKNIREYKKTVKRFPMKAFENQNIQIIKTDTTENK